MGTIVNPNDGVTGSIAMAPATSLPNKTQLVPLATRAINTAIAIVTDPSTTSSPSTIAAVQELGTAISVVAEQAASAAGGPLAGLAAEAVAPALGQEAASLLLLIGTKLRLEASTEFQAFQNWLSKL